MIEITKTGNAPKKLNVLVYGPPGTGKTCFGGTGEPRFKTLFVNAEGGTLSLNEQAKRQGIKEYDTTRITKFEDLRVIYDFLRNDKTHGYQLVVMDSGTEIQKVCMDHILATQNEKGQAYPLDKDGKLPPPRERPVMADWGLLNTKMTSLIRAMRDLPSISFIMTALETHDKNDETGETRVMANFQGGIKETIDGYFDQVLYAYVKEEDGGDGKKVRRHRMLTKNNGRIRAKDRDGKLPTIVDPDFCQMFDIIFPPQAEQLKEKA